MADPARQEMPQDAPKQETPMPKGQWSPEGLSLGEAEKRGAEQGREALTGKKLELDEDVTKNTNLLKDTVSAWWNKTKSIFSRSKKETGEEEIGKLEAKAEALKADYQKKAEAAVAEEPAPNNLIDLDAERAKREGVPAAESPKDGVDEAIALGTAELDKDVEAAGGLETWKLKQKEAQLSAEYDRLAETVAAEGAEESKAWSKALKTGKEPAMSDAGKKLNATYAELNRVKADLSKLKPAEKAAKPASMPPIYSFEGPAPAAPKTETKPIETPASQESRRQAAIIQHEIDTLSDEREGWTAETLAAIADATKRRDAALAEAQRLEAGGAPADEKEEEIFSPEDIASFDAAGEKLAQETRNAKMEDANVIVSEDAAGPSEAPVEKTKVAYTKKTSEDAATASGEIGGEPAAAETPAEEPMAEPAEVPAAEPVAEEKPAEPLPEPEAPKPAPAERPVRAKKEQAPKKNANSYDEIPVDKLKGYLEFSKKRLTDPKRFKPKEAEFERKLVAQMEESIARREKEAPKQEEAARASEPAPAEAAEVQAPEPAAEPAPTEEAPKPEAPVSFEDQSAEFRKVAETYLKDKDLNAKLTLSKAKKISAIDLAKLFVTAGVFDEEAASISANEFVQDPKVLEAARKQFLKELETLRAENKKP